MDAGTITIILASRDHDEPCMKCGERIYTGQHYVKDAVGRVHLHCHTAIEQATWIEVADMLEHTQPESTGAS